MVRARIRMFGPRLVVMLGRTHQPRATASPRPALACPSHGSGWNAIDQALSTLGRASAQRIMGAEVTPARR